MSAIGIPLSSSTSTTVDPQQDIPAPVDDSSLLGVTNNKSANEDQWNIVSSILPLLKEALGGELGIYKWIYSLVGTPQPTAWQQLRTCLASVKAFYVDKGTKDDGALLSPAVLLNVQMELGSTVRWSKWAKGKKEDGEAFKNFLQALPDKASELESLIIDHPEKVFKSNVGVFKNISHFRSLRKPHLQCPVMLEGIDDIKGLGMLPHLEELRLAISWWGWIEVNPSKKISIPISLDNIQRLTLSAPPHIFAEVVRAVQVTKLDCIIGECPSKSFWDLGTREIWEVMVEKWPTARMALATFLWSEENDYLGFADACAPMLRGALDLKSFLLGPSQANLIFFSDRGANVALSDLGDIANELPALVSLSLTVNASVVPSCDFKPLRHKLEQLTVYGAEPMERDKVFDVARYLHCLFPNLQGVRAKRESRDWKEVSKLVQFSHQVVADELRRVPWLSIGQD